MTITYGMTPAEIKTKLFVQLEQFFSELTECYDKHESFTGVLATCNAEKVIISMEFINANYDAAISPHTKIQFEILNRE